MDFIKKLLFISITFIPITYAEPIIHFGTDPTYPPFEYIDNTGKMNGFDIDIAKAICREMHATCKFTSQSFDNLLSAVNNGKLDAAIAAIDKTSKREQVVRFTNVYFYTSVYFVGPLDKQYTMRSIPGKRIGIQSGSAFEDYLQAKYSNKITIKTYPTYQDAFKALQTRKIDMVMSDTPNISNWLNQNNNNKKFAKIGGPIINNEFFGPGFAIAVKQSNTALLDKINNALDTIKSNGVYNKIVDKYFKGIDLIS